MEEESQMQTGQNIVNGCLCVLGLCNLFLVFCIFDQFTYISFIIKKTTLLEKDIFSCCSHKCFCRCLSLLLFEQHMLAEWHGLFTASSKLKELNKCCP